MRLRPPNSRGLPPAATTASATWARWPTFVTSPFATCWERKPMASAMFSTPRRAATMEMTASAVDPTAENAGMDPSASCWDAR